jgi:hypothetical protein
MENDNTEHRQFTIDRSNADQWLGLMRRVADRARHRGDHEGAERIDLLAEEVSACIASGWRDRSGKAVAQWDYQVWSSDVGDGTVSLRMQLRPIRLAA